MKKKQQLWIVLALFVVLAVAPAALACRIIPEPWPPHRPPVRPPRPPVRPPAEQPILTRKHHADIRVSGDVAKVSVRAVFYNPNPRDMEGTYFFPIGAGAVVRDFSMLVNGKEQKAELLDAEKARKIYEDIVRRMKDPGLLEYVGTGMLKARVYPIPPRGEVEVRLEYTEVVKTDAGLRRFRYPLLSAKPNAETIDEVSLRVSLKSSRPVKLFYSPTHKIDAIRKDDRNVTGGFERSKIVPEQDFDLYWSLDEADIGVSAVAFKPEDEDGYCMVSLTPRVQIEKDKIEPKDIVFVFDKSGSMAGPKIKQAKAALSHCLNSLNPEDRFAVVLFSTDIEVLTDTLVAAKPDAVAEAREAVAEIDARGGTAVHDALQKACGLFEDNERVGMIVFLTDGKPTIGTIEIPDILKATRNANRNARLFVFGVGNDVNTDLLDLLAAENRGTQTYVAEKEDIEVKVSSFYEKVSMPVLTDVSVTVDGVKLLSLYPRKVPDIFRGGQVLLFGRYRGEGRHDVVVRGRAGGREQAFECSADFDGDPGYAFLAPIWAHRKVAFLLEEIRTRGHNRELENEVVALGKRYGIVTPYTSFLIVDDNLPERQRRELEEARRKFRYDKEGADAVTMSRGVAGAKSLERAAASAPADLGFARPIAGRMGGGLSVGEPLARAAHRKIRKVADKVFYQGAGNVYYDSLFKEKDRDRVKEIAYLSDQYFALLDKHPGIGKYLAAKLDMVVCVDDEIYRIRHDGHNGR